MGIEHMILNAKQIFSIKCNCFVPFSLLFLCIIMLEIIDTTIRIKITVIKIQNRIMVGVFSKNIASLYRSKFSHWYAKYSQTTNP